MSKKYPALARRLELEDTKDDFDNSMQYLAECQKLPEELELCFHHLTEPGKGWNELCGVFPDDGLLLIYARFPSSNQSMLKRYYFSCHILLDLC